MLNYAGADQRQDDLFMNGNLFSRGKSLVKGLQGVENVYTQHSPHLLQTLDLLLKGRLRETSYPFLETEDGLSTTARTQRCSALARPPSPPFRRCNGRPTR
jgi:vacuolar protein sorting-associated protein 45